MKIINIRQFEELRERAAVFAAFLDDEVIKAYVSINTNVKKSLNKLTGSMQKTLSAADHKISVCHFLDTANEIKFKGAAFIKKMQDISKSPDAKAYADLVGDFTDLEDGAKTFFKDAKHPPRLEGKIMTSKPIS